MGTLIISCLKIFFCRIMDVTLGTMRTVLTVKGKNLFAALMGFCEVFLWYVIVKDALASDAPVIATAVSYAGGYAVGTFVGGKLADVLVSGNVTVQIVTSSQDPKLPEAIRAAGYGLTILDVPRSEHSDARFMIFSTADKKKLKALEMLVTQIDPKAFFMVQDTIQWIGGYGRAGK